MCYNPLRIKNPKLEFRAGLDAQYIDVPCGHCEECLSKSRTQWFIRNYFEWLDIKNANGFALMYTLTYNEDCVPTVQLNNKGCMIKYRVFSKRDVQLFMKRLRKNLKKRGFDYHTVRYFLCSEYGGITHRPHYHAIFYVKDVPEYIFRSAVKQSWTYGFVKASESGVINSPAGIDYVCKYVTKDDVFYKEVAPFANEEELKQIKPFHLNSRYFGYSINKLPLDNLYKNEIQVFRHGQYVMVEYPQYNQRTLLYDFNKETGRYTLNKLGENVKTQWFMDRLPKVVDNRMASIEDTRMLSENQVSLINDAQKTSFVNGNEVYNYIIFLLNKEGHTLYDLVSYELLFKNRSIYKMVDFDCVRLDEEQDYISFISNIDVEKRYREIISHTPFYVNKYDKDEQIHNVSSLFNSLPCFRDLDKISNIITLSSNLRRKELGAQRAKQLIIYNQTKIYYEQ